MSAKKTVFLIISVFVLYFTSFGCQHSLLTEREKQDRIMTMYRQYSQEFPLVEGITVEELQQLQQQDRDLILVDVRSQSERMVSYIPGAISTEEFESNLEQYQQKTIVAYCTIGYRSGKYAQKMQQRGVKVFNLEGSLLAWSHVRGKLTDSRGFTNKVHVFSRRWQLTAKDYKAIW
ncbi:MAG: rhodanese-like domain-containing protein [Cyanobacteria bacterium P01_A01_bin.83]